MTFEKARSVEDWLHLAREAEEFAACPGKSPHNRDWWVNRAEICRGRARIAAGDTDLISSQTEAMMLRHTPMAAGDMDIRAGLFGIRFTPGCSNGCAELYIEDDEHWHLKAVFDRIWLRDLQAVVNQAVKT